MLGNWRLLSSVVIGTLVAAAILSATAVYADAIRDLGLQYALRQQPAASLDVSIVTSNTSVSAGAYQRQNSRQDTAATEALHGTAAGVVRVVTSATFFVTERGGRPDTSSDNRPRANLVSQSGLQDHVDLVQGALPGAMARGATGPIAVAVGEDTAKRQNLEVGSVLDLFPFWDAQSAPLRAQVAAVVRAKDPTERYWGRNRAGVDQVTMAWPTLLLFVPEGTLFGAASERIPTLSADYENRYLVRTDALNARVSQPIADGLKNLPGSLATTETRPTVASALEQVLRSFDQKLFFTRIPLLVLLLQIGGIVGYYLVMVSTMLIERQAAEIATLRSRGATTGQLLAQYGVEGAILALLAALAGPPIAAAVVSALGPTPAFAALSGGHALEVTIGSGAYLLAMAGALLAFVSLMIPAWRATRVTVLEFKRGAARPRPTPVLLRYYVDVLAVGIVALTFWRLSRENALFTKSLFGSNSIDPFLLATPAVFMVTVGVVFLRLFPLVMRVVGWLVSQTKSAAVLIGVRSLVRNPTHYARLILLLMFATGVGMFGATFSATLERSYEERASYAAGADMRATAISLANIGPSEFAARVQSVPAEARSTVIRQEVSLANGKRATTAGLLAIDPATFEGVAYFRDDFAATNLHTMLARLAEHGPGVPPGPMLPASARQLGVWVRMTDIRGRVVLGVTLRDATGRFSNRQLGDARPADATNGEWVFFTADLQQPISVTGAPARTSAVNAPFEVRGLWVQPSGAIASQHGIVQLGPAFTTTASPADAAVPLSTLAAAWPGATLVQDFTQAGFEALQGTRPTPLTDTVRPTAGGPPGFGSSMRYEWQETGFVPPMRGIRPVTDATPIRVYIARDTARALEAKVGDTIAITANSRTTNAQVAGILDYFPTYVPAQGKGLIVADGAQLTTAINAALPDLPLVPNEAWFATNDLPATRAGMKTFEALTLVERSVVRAQQQDDPLIAAGWAGILSIAFGAVLLLSAIGFVVYSYLTAQQRALEFAILRTLGFSRPQILSVVVFEHLFVIIAGMGLGTLVGLRVGRLMLAFLGIDEQGGQVVPPFVQRISWPEVFVVWGILGTVFIATIAAVVALYFRLAVSRALRIGDT